MNLFADESVDRPIVERLRQEGHTVSYVAELAPGIADDEVLQRASAAGAPLLTADKDFGELVFRQGRAHAGVILLRLAGQAPGAKADLVVGALRDHGAELPGAFTVVTPDSIRIRKTAPPASSP
jgi:predicted nuclease of predicted toxin-antitoxin system